MTRLLPLLVSLALVLYSFFDIVKRPDDQIRRLPKWGWIIVILLFSGLGGAAYLLLGRTLPGNGRGGRRGKPRIIPPDDDPDFLKKL